MGLEENLRAARSVKEEMWETLSFRPANIPGPTAIQLKLQGDSRPMASVEIQGAVTALQDKSKSKSGMKRVDAVYAAFEGKRIQTATCGPASDIAYKLLAERGIRPIEIVSVSQPGSSGGFLSSLGNLHAFVLIGRDPGSQITDVQNWGQDTVVFDPWLGLIGSYAEAKIALSTLEYNYLNHLSDAASELYPGPDAAHSSCTCVLF